MKKIFTLAAAVLASFSLWAVEPNLAINTESQGAENFVKAYETEGITLSSTASFSSGAVQLGNTPSSYDQHYFEVLAGSAEIDSISFLISGNGSNKNIQAPLFGWAETATSNTADTYVLLDPKVVTANSYAAAQWFTYDLSNAEVMCARIYRTTKYVSSVNPEYTGSSTALGTGQTIKIYGLKVWLKDAVTKYEVSFDANGGTGSMAALKYAEGAEVVLPACTFTAPEGKEFDAWTSEDVVIADGKFTMPANAVSIVATWKNHVVGHDATLSDLKVNGETVTGFAADNFAYNVELGVYEAIEVTATATDPFATVNISINELVPTQYLVQVIAEDGENAQTYTVDYARAAATALVAISESTTWDWANAGSPTAEQKATTVPSNAEEFNFADVLIEPAASFNAAALIGIAQFANRGTYFQGTQISFKTTVAGSVVVTYSNTGGDRPYRHIELNGTLSAEGSADQTMKETEAFNVPAGDVVIKFYIPDANNPKARENDNVGYAMGRISKIVFTANGGGTTGIDNTAAEVKAVKRVINGQLFIEKAGVLYNAQGAVVK